MQAVSSQTAGRVLEVLKGVVERGTGTEAAISGVSVAGKTGTAEHQGREDDSWFVGIAPADKPSVVVVVALEQAGKSVSADARTLNVLQTALSVQGVL